MLILGKQKHWVPTLLAILVFFVSKSTSDEGLTADNYDANKVTEAVTAKLEKCEDKDDAGSDSEKHTDETESENDDEEDYPNEEEENEDEKPEEGEHPPRAVNSDSKEASEKAEEAEQPTASQEGSAEEKNPAVADGYERPVEMKTKQNKKLAPKVRKIYLSDVDSITHDERHSKQTKRETRATEFLGLPRDASYFFDDLEPFINNNSATDNLLLHNYPRSVRAISPQGNRGHKTKVAAKKLMEDEESEDEEEEDNEKDEDEGEKGSEEEYDDDEEAEADCQSSPKCTRSTCTTEAQCEDETECTTARQCTTTRQCTKPTCTQRKTTSKCTTKFVCSTKCPTTEECTRCPRICAKGCDKHIPYPQPEKTKSWNVEGKRLKKKFNGI